MKLVHYVFLLNLIVFHYVPKDSISAVKALTSTIIDKDSSNISCADFDFTIKKTLTITTDITNEMIEKKNDSLRIGNFHKD